ncbi:arsinothricin resistance N-acetyltransferase ArsN1 family B [Salinigranum sp. GCM10025319]|uniref:arsinothricin resistance N-acetyltransferase ArsN1 family B n=1 Tax=Salinigranum sp. GCM10025319 TaxID=3252687 RepID=UPI00360DF615
MDGSSLRVATPADASAVRDVYAPYVEETAVSFATAAPSVEALEGKIETTLRRNPWLVCERDGDVIGYAYAGPFRERDAYQWTTETSVYVDREAHREGVGRALYEALLELVEAQGYASAVGVVTLPNPASVGLHESLGFEHVGTFDDVGYKNGAWHDVGWWRLRLPSPAAPDPPRAFADLSDERVRAALSG